MDVVACVWDAHAVQDVYYHQPRGGYASVTPKWPVDKYIITVLSLDELILWCKV